MSYITLFASKSTAIFKDRPNTNDHTSDKVALAEGDALLVGLPALDAAYRKRRINYVRVSYAPYPAEETGEASFRYADAYTNAASFTQSTVTYSNAPAKLYKDNPGSSYSKPYYHEMWTNAEQARTALLYGVRIEAKKAFMIETSRGTNNPRFGVSLSDEDIGLTPYGSPSSGYISKNIAQTLSWENAGQFDAYTEQTQTAAKVYWRNGTSGAWTVVNLTTETSTTLAVGSLTGDQMQWYVEVTSSSGVTTQSPIYTLTTAEALSTAQPIAPVGTIVDGQQAVVFSWDHIISTGTAQTAADLQQSADGVTWTTLASISGAAQTYTAAAGTLTPGTLYWRVRTYNADGSAGSWSDAAQIVVVAPAGAPNVTVTTSPLPTVSWAAQGQEGYQVQLDDYDSGQIYGTATSWTPPEYLSDGQHTARVRVVNVYGLWSDWGGTVFTVANTPGNAITLTVQASSGNASLAWSTSGYDSFRIYRDDELIGETKAEVYEDLYAPAGSHTYYVRGILAGGDYGLSNSETVDLQPDAIILTDPETGAQLRVTHCLAGNLQIQRKRARAVTVQHYRGSAWPTAEISPDENETYTFAPVFLSTEKTAAAQFEALLGRPVHLRDIHGTAFFGIMAEQSAAVMPKWTSYAVTVTRIQYPEATV